MIQSKYLKTADVTDPVIVTIARVVKVNIAKEDDPPQYKWAAKFEEFQKPMILNSTNIRIAEKVFKSDNTDDWNGKEIILFTDDSVTYMGEAVGGLRFKGQEKAPVKAAKKQIETLNEEDEVPF